MAKKPGEIVAVKVRMREWLRRELEAEAKKRETSLNKEIERRLEKSFQIEMTGQMFQLIADLAVDTAYSRIGLSKPSDMIDRVHTKLGSEAAKTFAAALVDSTSRKEKKP
jgi:hypothetical protein